MARTAGRQQSGASRADPKGARQAGGQGRWAHTGRKGTGGDGPREGEKPLFSDSSRSTITTRIFTSSTLCTGSAFTVHIFSLDWVGIFFWFLFRMVGRPSFLHVMSTDVDRIKPSRQFLSFAFQTTAPTARRRAICAPGLGLYVGEGGRHPPRRRRRGDDSWHHLLVSGPPSTSRRAGRDTGDKIWMRRSSDLREIQAASS